MEYPPHPSPRIVSLLPAATEIVAGLGLRANLVGRSHECDEPADVACLPALTAPRIDAAAPSREIHDQVTQLGRALAAPSPQPAAGANCTTGVSAAIFSLDVDTLATLKPDLILTQAACDVCAISAADVDAAVRKADVDTRVLALSPATLADLFADILAVGKATGRLAQARELVARLRARIDSLACRVRTFPDRPRVAMIEWLDPPMAAGNWVPEMVRLAGGLDVLGKAGDHSHWITWDDVAAADPDVVILVPCGFPLDRVVAEAASPAVRPHLEKLRACREGKVFAIDGHHLFNRPGPRLVDSLEVLAEILHPGRFAFAATRRFANRVVT
jgi:iron complex transport system substrate-binding protein